MEMITVAHHPNPVTPIDGRVFKQHQWQDGQPIRAVLLDHGFDPHQEIVISINDRLLTVDEWDTVSPLPGDLVHVQVAVSGGGGGSNPLKIIATLAISYFAPGIGDYLAVSMGLGTGATAGTFFGITASQLVGGVVSMVGNAVVGAIFQPSSNKLNKAAGHFTGEKESPTYSLSGGSNQARPFGPLPVIFGTHRFFPDTGARPYVEYNSGEQYLYQIFNFGVSAITYEDLKIGTTAIGNYAGLELYGTNADGSFGAFPGNVDTTTGAEIRRDGSFVVRTSSPDTYRLAVDLEGSVYYAGDEGLETCYAEVEIWYAVAGSGNWVSTNLGTVVSYGDGYWSKGYWVNETFGIMTWHQVEYGSTSAGDHVDGESAGTAYYGFQSLPMIWRWRPYSEITTPEAPTTLLDAAPARPVTYTAVPAMTIDHGAQQRPQRKTIFIDVATGTYDVRVRLNRAWRGAGEISDTDNRGGVQYMFAQLRSYQTDTATYVGQYRLGMIARATGQLNGVVQQLSCTVRAYSPIWTGSAWEWRNHSNPAYWFLDFAVGRYNANGVLMYGVGLDISQIDVDAIIAWGAFCDTEGLSINVVVDSQQTCADVLNTIARCGLGSMSWASGKLGAVWDARNASASAVFGMSNIIKGSFQVEYLNDNLADEIIVNYINAVGDWQAGQVRVKTPGTVNPERPTTVDLMGCTNAAMAGKFANVLAAQQYYRRRRITWECDFEGFVCQRGDVVMLSHDLTQWGYSGRIVSVAGVVVTLDRAVPRSGVAEYMMIRQPDGTLTTYTVTASTGESDTLTLTSAPALQGGYDEIDHLWFFSPLATPGKLVKIVSAQPTSETRIRITATDENPEFYAAWDGVWTEPSNPTLLKNIAPEITSIVFSETLALIGLGVVGAKVTLAFTAKGATDKINFRYRFGTTAPWTNVELTTFDYEFLTEETGILYVEATPILYTLVGPTVKVSDTIYGKTLKPSDVDGFAIAVMGGVAELSYYPAPDLDVTVGGSIKIRFSSQLTGARWENAQDLATFSGNSTYTTVLLAAGTYFAKWVDSLGNESRNAALIVNELDANLLDMNVVATLDDGAAWPGVKVDMAYDSTLQGIKLDSIYTIDEIVDFDMVGPVDIVGGISSVGTYALDSSIDLGRVVVSRVTSRIEFKTFNATDFIENRAVVDEWVDVDSFGDPVDSRLDLIDLWADIDGTETTAGQAWVEISISDDNVTWSAWQPHIVSNESFRYLKARVAVSTSLSYVNVLVTSASLIVDMPDRSEQGADVVCPAIGTTITFNAPFMIPPAIAISGQAMATGDYFTLSGKSSAGFDIVFKNSAGAGVSRTFDWISKGY